MFVRHYATPNSLNTGLTYCFPQSFINLCCDEHSVWWKKDIFDTWSNSEVNNKTDVDSSICFNMYFKTGTLLFMLASDEKVTEVGWILSGAWNSQIVFYGLNHSYYSIINFKIMILDQFWRNQSLQLLSFKS